MKSALSMAPLRLRRLKGDDTFRKTPSAISFSFRDRPPTPNKFFDITLNSQPLLPQNQIRPLTNLSIQPLGAVVEILRMPIKLVSVRLPRPIRNKINQLFADAASPGLGIYEEVVQVEVGLNARRRIVWVVVCEADDFAVGFGDAAVDGVVGVEEAVESRLRDFVGDRAFVEDVVLVPEVDPGFFVGGLDGADLDSC